MFKNLQNKIIIITMTITTAVLIVAGASIMFFSSTIRPEPNSLPNFTIIEITDNNSNNSANNYNDQKIKEYIRNDRTEGNFRLLITLISVGLIIEIAVFLITYYLSEKIVAPVKDAYDKQKLFIANASHELKTPLAVIEANMEAIEVDKDNEKWKNNIESEITHANKLVLDLLQLAKMDAGNIDHNPPENINLINIINEHIALFQPKFSGLVTFKHQSANSKYYLSKQDITQVLDILLDNAVKYGKNKISITLNSDSLTITNDGTTISKPDLDKIFDRFYQTDKTKPGSGLGLAIAKAICHQNHWQISCASTSRTTTFTINFSHH